ncbi:hypothetical protein [Metabacillus arenae]|uniref:Uncharacterized protein n=1 Tax=Metabacillus arenae TaxID=2771434 RepID=A0A926NGW6_9BACI|nr:hypothetical protein [Metabacillus arenae]MBD1380323.1 hypothetical protein [Metabacillus arenae]
MNQQYEPRFVLLAFMIIVGIGGIIFSFFAPNVIQYIFLQTKQTIYLKTPFLSNILFLASTITLTAALFIFYQWGKRGIGLGIGASLVTVALLIFSSFHFHHVTEKTIEWNEPFQLTKNSYTWEDIDRVRYIPAKSNDGLDEVIFHFKDTKTLSFLRSSDFHIPLSEIKNLLTIHNIPYELESTANE